MGRNNLPSEKNDWEKFEKNNVAIPLHILYVKKEKIYPSYVWKYNSNCEKNLILLLIPIGEKCKARSKKWWHHLAVKKNISVVKRNNKKEWFLLLEFIGMWKKKIL